MSVYFQIFTPLKLNTPKIDAGFPSLLPFSFASASSNHTLALLSPATIEEQQFYKVPPATSTIFLQRTPLTLSYPSHDYSDQPYRLPAAAQGSDRFPTHSFFLDSSSDLRHTRMN